MSTFSAKIGEFSYFCEILQNPPLFELIPQIPILKNLSPLLGQKSHKTGKFPPSGHTGENLGKWDKLGQVETSWDELGQVGTSWDELGTKEITEF